MDNLFGVPLTSILVGLLVLMGVSLAVVAWVGWRQPILFRMGLRNLVRRRAQTALIVVGLMLSTLIMSAAFATGDTVAYSVTNEIYNSLEEVDFLLVHNPDRAQEGDPAHLTDGFLEGLRDAFAADPDIDGITGVLVRTLPVVNPARRLSSPATQVVGVDPDTIDSFRGLRTLSGKEIPASALGGNRVYITENLADEIEAGPGDTLTIYAANEPHTVEVIDVVRDTSVTSAGGGPLAGGLVAHLDTVRALDGEPDELSMVVVSSRGGIRDSLKLSDTVQDKLEGYLDATPGANAEIAFTKQEQVALGELVGSFFVTFFLLFGLFSIAAGVMLIFLIFVMLAAERRSEMGMARAVGMRRLHLTEMFLSEGSGYNVGAAAVGAVLGVVVALALTWVLGLIVGEFGLSIAFHVNAQGFVIAFAGGVVLTFATIAFASFRAANLNIVRAIRDLPEPQPLRGADRSAGSLLRAMVGVLWTLGWIGLVALWVAAGVALFIFSLGTYGVGVVALLVLGAWFVYGVRASGRPFSSIRGWRRALYLLWWAAFSVLALITWILRRTNAWAARHRNPGGWAMWMLLLGLLGVYFGGWQTQFLFAYTGGTTLAVLAIAMLAVYFGSGARAAFTVAGLVLVWYWLLPLPFSLIGDWGRGFRDPVDGVLRIVGLDPDPGPGNIEMFFVSGISITASATLVVIFNAEVLLGAVSALGRTLGSLAPAVKTAVAYPLAARFRTGMTLAMFALVVFSLVVMATMNSNFTQLFTSDDATGGFEVVVDANALNPIGDLRQELAATGFDAGGRIAGVGAMRAALAEVRENAAPPSEDATLYQVVDVDEEFLRLARLPLAHRAQGFESDEAVMRALLTDPTAAVADDTVLGVEGFGGGGPNLFQLEAGGAIRGGEPWQPVAITARNRETGEEIDLRIIATLEPQVSGILPQFQSIFTHGAGVQRLEGDGRLPEHFFVIGAGGSSKRDVEALADDIESALLERGVQARSIRDLIDEQARISNGFQALFEGFMGLGLIVGIAALGVIAFRTVVERRQQIGVLRAIGYSRRLIAASFFMESSFIALTGIAIGLLMGTALSYNILTDPEFTEGAKIAFHVPWARILLISAIAYGASALMTLVPARSASRVVPAEALRYE